MGKQLQIAVELLPGTKKAGMPLNVASVASAVRRREAEKVAAALRVELVVVDVRAKDEIDAALRRLANNGVDVAVVPLFYSERRRLAVLAEVMAWPGVASSQWHTASSPDDRGGVSDGK